MPRIPLLRNPSRALTPVKMDRERWIVLEPLAFCLLFLCLSRGWLLRSVTDLIWFLAVIIGRCLKWTFMQYPCLHVHVKTRRRGKNIFEPFIIKLTAVDGLK